MADSRDAVPTSVRVAVAIVAVQVLGLLVAAIVLVAKTITGDPHSVAGALLGSALALATALLLVVCGRGLLGLRPAARTPIVVIELLALPVSYSLSFQADRLAYGAPILLSALVVLYLVFTPPAREALDRDIHRS
ncbi:MAG: hypothetical protein JO147_02100 [Actinobacteria bacterium]|nr:hypothetical protein [Actinomycetota bacterium]